MMRSLLALLILTNYLWLAGIGCISRPEQNPYIVKIEKSYQQSNRYEDCRYLRMDGLDAFFAEAMETKYQKDSGESQHHNITVTSGIDCHFLPGCLRILSTSFSQSSTLFSFKHKSPLPAVAYTIFSPPKQSLTV